MVKFSRLVKCWRAHRKAPPHSHAAVLNENDVSRAQTLGEMRRVWISRCHLYDRSMVRDVMLGGITNSKKFGVSLSSKTFDLK
jgi:uncharacterized membrane protein